MPKVSAIPPLEIQLFLLHTILHLWRTQKTVQHTKLSRVNLIQDPKTAQIPPAGKNEVPGKTEVSSFRKKKIRITMIHKSVVLTKFNEQKKADTKQLVFPNPMCCLLQNTSSNASLSNRFLSIFYFTSFPIRLISIPITQCTTVRCSSMTKYTALWRVRKKHFTES